MNIRFVVQGEPVGKGRPKFVRATGRTYTPEKTVVYENLVQLQYELQSNGVRFGTLPVGITIKACFAPPKSASKKMRELMLENKIRPCKKPDADNIAKAVCDALNGIAYDDDSQIVELNVEKKYAETSYVDVVVYDCGEKNEKRC